MSDIPHIRRDCAFGVMAAFNCQRHHPGGFSIFGGLGVKSLRSRMPGSIVHTSDVCFQPSLQQGCLQVDLSRIKVCLRRAGCQHEQRIVNKVKHLYAQCARCHLILICKPAVGTESSGRWTPDSSPAVYFIATRRRLLH